MAVIPAKKADSKAQAIQFMAGACSIEHDRSTCVP
jgi:hypothetical protein